VNPELKARVAAARDQNVAAHVAQAEKIADRQRRFNVSLTVKCPHGNPYAWFCQTCRTGADWWED
jgi:hypothetical protein